MGDSKFFFEEDAEAEVDTGVSYEEQADIFGAAVEEAGLNAQMGSMAPMQAQVTRMELKEVRNVMILIEYGIVDRNYVVHITPLHPQRNLRDKNKLNAAIRVIVPEMNKVVPFDVPVKIHLPQEDWDVKVLSFVIEGGAEAWNFDTERFATEVVPSIHAQLTDICVKL